MLFEIPPNEGLFLDLLDERLPAYMLKDVSPTLDELITVRVGTATEQDKSLDPHNTPIPILEADAPLNEDETRARKKCRTEQNLDETWIEANEGRKIFLVHENLIRARSPFFNAALKPTWREGLERMVDLPDMNPEAFENYRHFLYTYKLDSLEGCRVEEFSLLNSRQKCCEIVLESLIYQNLLHLDYQSLLKCHELGDYIMDFGFRDAISNALREKLRNDHALPFTVPGLMYTISEPGSPLRKMLRFHAVFHLYRWTADFRDNQNVDPLHPDLMADILLTRFQIDQTLHAINLNGCDATRPLIPMFWRANVAASTHLLPHAMGDKCQAPEDMGTCQKTSNCDGMAYANNFCPSRNPLSFCPSSNPFSFCPSDPVDVQCCGKIACPAPHIASLCRHTNQGCSGGQFISNLCPGDSLIRCCVESAAPSNPCADPQPNSCTFYSDCLEAQVHCGPSGYPLGYGLKYCTLFTAAKNKFSSAGQIWLTKTRLCLQCALVPYATGTKATTCPALKKTAFGTHPTCYVDSGVCTLPVGDWGVIVETVSLKELFGSMDALKATLETVEGCADFYAWLIERVVKVESLQSEKV
ncbi:hypothetical protein K432DRAFT_404586 [Lepidopterella palustris CBS 459.81]|uniref:BTB domain-containing protein n=1 Tax=Lepidopterella palustris CBS 459.81 TaxID=1314670 RepID=A0A8E2JFG3_9PEZI|nr:hypothetical protein K432DRAFT_404586 [Lepidopterella palustris CBS 459.81]